MSRPTRPEPTPIVSASGQRYVIEGDATSEDFANQSTREIATKQAVKIGILESQLSAKDQQLAEHYAQSAKYHKRQWSITGLAGLLTTGSVILGMLVQTGTCAPENGWGFASKREVAALSETVAAIKTAVDAITEKLDAQAKEKPRGRR